MKMHRALGRTGRSRGEGDERDIVMRGRDIGEAGTLPRHQRLQPVRPVIVEMDDAAQRRRFLARQFKFVA